MKNGEMGAFARPATEYDSYGRDGLTKREFMATLILTGICGGNRWYSDETTTQYVEKAIIAADELLKQLEGTK